MKFEDWRGVPINEGDLVIYGAGVGRSISMVEATVAGFAKEKVRLNVIRRSFGGGERAQVTVGADRLTVVNSLPPTSKATQAMENIEAKKRIIEYHEKCLREIHHGISQAYTWSTIDYHEDRINEFRREIDKLECG